MLMQNDVDCYAFSSWCKNTAVTGRQVWTVCWLWRSIGISSNLFA